MTTIRQRGGGEGLAGGSLAAAAGAARFVLGTVPDPRFVMARADGQAPGIGVLRRFRRLGRRRLRLRGGLLLLRGDLRRGPAERSGQHGGTPAMPRAPFRRSGHHPLLVVACAVRPGGPCRGAEMQNGAIRDGAVARERRRAPRTPAWNSNRGAGLAHREDQCGRYGHVWRGVGLGHGVREVAPPGRRRRIGGPALPTKRAAAPQPSLGARQRQRPERDRFRRTTRTGTGARLTAPSATLPTTIRSTVPTPRAPTTSTSTSVAARSSSSTAGPPGRRSSRATPRA